MAVRPVYVPAVRAPFVSVYWPGFAWNAGFAASQKQKNIAALHAAHRVRFPESRILEISSRSLQELGVRLSAFHLKKYVPALGAAVPVECVFQGGKVFAAGGPYTDLYGASPRDAKRDPRLRSSGMLTGFSFDGRALPLRPKTAFYDWLYINALLEDPALAAGLLAYDAFTDIEFNPDRSINCQANAAALFVALSRQGRAEQCRDFDSFCRMIQPEKR